MSVQIENLAAFRRDLKAAKDSSPRELAKGIKAAGVPVVDRAKQLAGAASRTGAHAGGFRAATSGARGNIVNRVRYAGGAEWGSRGKWAGFNRYGARGSRFASRALDEKAEDVGRIILEELKRVIELMGWAR